MPDKKTYDYLFETILKLENKDECYDFFNDLCTIKELNAMNERLLAAKLLMEGNTYDQIIAQTDISSATLSRISRCVQYGDGYKKIINK